MDEIELQKAISLVKSTEGNFSLVGLNLLKQHKTIEEIVELLMNSIEKKELWRIRYDVYNIVALQIDNRKIHINQTSFGLNLITIGFENPFWEFYKTYEDAEIDLRKTITWALNEIFKDD